MREILVMDYQGEEIPTMEASDANADCLRPTFKQVAFYDQSAVRALYQELGGGRREGSRTGSTVIIPNRSAWASLWRISPDEVRVIAVPDSKELSREDQSLRKDNARARNRLMRG